MGLNFTWVYVGTLYAVATWRTLPRRIALLFYALVLVFFFKPMTQRYVNVPVDMLTTIPPWGMITERKFLNPEMNDVTFQHAPWAHQARESLKSLRAPLWNEAAGSGYPLLANGQSSALSPIRILALPLPLGYALSAEAAIKLLIALTFTFLYCRGRGWSELASTFGAVAFGFGGFLAVWLHFPHVTTACFLPAVLYLIDRLAERRTFGAFVMAAVVWASIVYGGHPETASHIFVLATLYVIWIVFVERIASWRLFLTLGGAMTVAALLSAPFLLPFAEAVRRSQRYESLQVAPWSAESLPYAEWKSALVQLQPHFYGRVPMEGKWGPSDPDTIAGWAGILGIASWVALLVSVIRRRAWRSREMFFVVATVFVFGTMMAWPGLGEGVHLVMPLVAHHRFRLLLCMLLAIQSACVIQRLQDGERVPLLVGLGVVAATLVAALMLMDFPESKWLHSALLAAIPSAAVIVIATIAARATRNSQPATFLLLVAVIADVWSITYVWSPPLPETMMYPRTPLITALEKLKSDEPFRIAGWGAAFFPNNAAMFGFEDIRVHDPMANAKYMGFLKLAADYESWEYFAMWKNTQTPLLDYLNVKYMLLDDPNIWFDGARWETVYSGADGRIIRNRTVLPRFYPVRNVILEFRDEVFYPRLKDHKDWAHTALLDDLKLETPQMHDDFFNPRPESSPLATSRIVDAKNADYRVKVSAPRWSLVVSSIPWWPGWKIERNGQRVDPIRVNGLFLGFAVPPGESDVRVWYSPWTYWVGVWMAAATAATLLVAGYRLLVASRESPQATSN